MAPPFRRVPRLRLLDARRSPGCAGGAHAKHAALRHVAHLVGRRHGAGGAVAATAHRRVEATVEVVVASAALDEEDPSEEGEQGQAGDHADDNARDGAALEAVALGGYFEGWVVSAGGFRGCGHGADGAADCDGFDDWCCWRGAISLWFSEVSKAR